ncbi:hypothetical protein BsWGS_11412 [Bradybaena similaris]
MSHSLSDWQTVSSDCRLIKSRYRSRKCTLCVHLEDLKNSLRKYCRSLLKEGNQTARRNLLQRDTNIQTCNMARVRIPTTDVNIKKSNNQNMKLLAEKLLSSFAKKNASSVILENAASITGLKMLSSPKVHQRECNMEGINQVNVAHPSGSQLTQKNKRPCSLEKPHDITLISHFISTDKSLQKSAHQNVPLGDGDGNIENTRRNANINNDSNSFLSLKQMTESAHSYVDSFDVVPKPVQHEYPHVSITRKKSDRNKLEAVSCQQCCKYYQSCGLSKEGMKKKINHSSRHRERYHAPNTPPHFWSLGFPDTAEIIDNNGECPDDITEATTRWPRRRVPLEKKF